MGAGQGLIVAELRKKGVSCDGVDLSSEMISARAGWTAQADACAMPLGTGTYRTIIYATGVIDFMSDEEKIRVIMNEGRRIADHAGSIFVAFYKISAATEDFLKKLGLLDHSVFGFREMLDDLPPKTGSDDRVDGEAGQSWFLPRGAFGDALVDTFLVAGKKKRVPHAANLCQSGPG